MAPTKMMCLNAGANAELTYTGKENTPQGLGYAAGAEMVGKLMKGRDGAVYMVILKNREKTWKKIPEDMAQRMQKEMPMLTKVVDEVRAAPELQSIEKEEMKPASDAEETKPEEPAKEKKVRKPRAKKVVEETKPEETKPVSDSEAPAKEKKVRKPRAKKVAEEAKPEETKPASDSEAPAQEKKVRKPRAKKVAEDAKPEETKPVSDASDSEAPAKEKKVSVRKAPVESATDFEEGTEKEGAEGVIYVVKADKNGTKKWMKKANPA